MNFDAPHMDFVLASYGVTAVVLIGLIAVYVFRARALDRRSKALSDQGAPRRRQMETETA